MFTPKGYSTGSCYMGFLPGEKRLPFPTEEEYLEYIKELIDEAA